MSVPKWNTFSRGLVVGYMDLAREFLADEGFLVTMCMAEHIGEFIAEASRVGLMLLRTWTVMCNQKAYRHPLTREAVSFEFFFFCFLSHYEKKSYVH